MANWNHDDKPAALEPEPEPEAKADKKAIEAWGEDKGLWPQFAQPGSRGAASYWKFAAARTHMNWAEGQLVTEAEFDDAVKAALSQVHR